MSDIYRSDREMILVALGGNALIRQGEKGDISGQEHNADETARHLMTLVDRDYNIVITHGNGPQVGLQLLKTELSKAEVPEMPLDVLVAETEGSMGYLLQQAFLNHLNQVNVRRYVVTVITQVVVERNDPAFKDPTKPIGQFFSKENADALSKQYGWRMIEDAGRGYRRVVPSPDPIKVVQRYMIRHSAAEGNIVIAGGGGGVPIWIKENGEYEGIEAVIDKDLTSALLATEIKADKLIILMPLPRIYIHFNTPKQKELRLVHLEKLKQYMAEGHFPPGNIGPKVQAVINFMEDGGKHAIITTVEHLSDALDGNEGTHIIP